MMTADEETTIDNLRAIVRQFVEERDWRQFHTPKNISMAMAIECAELMEHFQWIDGDQSRGIANEPEKLRAVEEELADVLCYVLALANELDIDLATVLDKKMVKNRQKYPAEEFRGRYGPEDLGPEGGG